jgi:hypothetical protein
LAAQLSCSPPRPPAGKSSDRHLFSFLPGDQPCQGLEQVLWRYRELAPCVRLAGPTSFAPAIQQATQIVASSGQYHILLLIADGQVRGQDSIGLLWWRRGGCLGQACWGIRQWCPMLVANGWLCSIHQPVHGLHQWWLAVGHTRACPHSQEARLG